jgi:hypothetical protein
VNQPFRFAHCPSWTAAPIGGMKSAMGSALEGASHGGTFVT